MARITQQNLLIGPFAKIDASHWLRCKLQYLTQFSLSFNTIFTTITSLHTISTSNLAA